MFIYSIHCHKQVLRHTAAQRVNERGSDVGRLLIVMLHNKAVVSLYPLAAIGKGGAHLRLTFYPVADAFVVMTAEDVLDGQAFQPGKGIQIIRQALMEAHALTNGTVGLQTVAGDQSAGGQVQKAYTVIVVTGGVDQLEPVFQNLAVGQGNIHLHALEKALGRGGVGGEPGTGGNGVGNGIFHFGLGAGVADHLEITQLTQPCVTADMVAVGMGVHQIGNVSRFQSHFLQCRDQVSIHIPAGGAAVDEDVFRTPE